MSGQVFCPDSCSKKGGYAIIKVLMLKQKVQNLSKYKKLPGVLLLSLLISGSAFIGMAKADQFDEQINANNQQIAANQIAANQWQAQAANYQDAVNRLQGQIDGIRSAILDYQHQSDALQRQIDADQQQLVEQKAILGENIKAMYLEGDISTLELLAASKNLSEYVDKQEYRNSVQDKIKTTVDKVTALKTELEQKQRDIQGIIADQEKQQAQLDSSLGQQNSLLAYTESQKAAYDGQITSLKQQNSALRAAQLAANRKLGGSVVAGDPGHGGYPANWANAPQDSMFDSWGMYNRECVSYTAWKVYEAYGYMPYWGGSGNANQWPADARAAGIPTDNNPAVGSVAISLAGGYGHAMWVEAVSGNSIYVSQYNFDLAGHYSEMWVNGSSFTYIHFH